MHPTADKPAFIFGYVLGRRVMPGVGCGRELTVVAGEN
jgi:hypothetical protein